MDRLLSLQVFSSVISEGGFSSAARALDLSPTAVSRLISDLEDHLGTRLIQRTTRKHALTESGLIYLQMTQSVLRQINDADIAAQKQHQRADGYLAHTRDAHVGVVFFFTSGCALARNTSGGDA